MLNLDDLEVVSTVTRFVGNFLNLANVFNLQHVATQCTDEELCTCL